MESSNLYSRSKTKMITKEMGKQIESYRWMEKLNIPDEGE